jgi:hypothetical protein
MFFVAVGAGVGRGRRAGKGGEGRSHAQESPKTQYYGIIFHHISPYYMGGA